MLLAVMIPGAPLSIKVVGVFLAGAGLARLGVPHWAAEWLRQNSDRLTRAVDPGASEVAETPRVPLEDLLAATPDGGTADMPGAARPHDGTAAGQEQPASPASAGSDSHQP